MAQYHSSCGGIWINKGFWTLQSETPEEPLLPQKIAIFSLYHRFLIPFTKLSFVVYHSDWILYLWGLSLNWASWLITAFKFFVSWGHEIFITLFQGSFTSLMNLGHVFLILMNFEKVDFFLFTLLFWREHSCSTESNLSAPEPRRKNQFFSVFTASK